MCVRNTTAVELKMMKEKLCRLFTLTFLGKILALCFQHLEQTRDFFETKEKYTIQNVLEKWLQT